jgi:hypothetical protein
MGKPDESQADPRSPQPDSARRSIDLLGFDGFGPEEYELTPAKDDSAEWDEADDSRLGRLAAVARRTAGRLAWLGLAALVALGAAGLVAATGRSPANDGRPELTYAADTALSDRLDAAVRDLTRLNQDVIHLGTLTRGVLADVSQLDQQGLATDYQDGDATVASITGAAAELTARLECEPWPAARDAQLALTYGQALIERWHQACAAIDSVAPLADDWAALVSGSKVVIEVTNDIGTHDSNAATALQLATQGRYAQALTQLALATGALDDADRIATLMAKVGDVSTLTQWLDRTRTMDDALALLWQTMIDSNGRVTEQVTAALKAVNDAKELLPDNNSFLQVVIYELAGGLTTHGISIETSKGQLGLALNELTGGFVTGG